MNQSMGMYIHAHLFDLGPIFWCPPVSTSKNTHVFQERVTVYIEYGAGGNGSLLEGVLIL